MVLRENNCGENHRKFIRFLSRGLQWQNINIKLVLILLRIPFHHFILYCAGNLSYHILSYRSVITSYIIFLYCAVSISIKLNHIILYHIKSYHFISYYIISYHIISYHIISLHIIWYDMIWYYITSYHIVRHTVSPNNAIKYNTINIIRFCIN